MSAVGVEGAGAYTSDTGRGTAGTGVKSCMAAGGAAEARVQDA